jgi:hypothetical protein
MSNCGKTNMDSITLMNFMLIGRMMLLVVRNCLVFLQNALLHKAFQYREVECLPPLAHTARDYKT